MPDLFDKWVSDLPESRRFRKSAVPAGRAEEFAAWKETHGLQETPDYDLAGAFLSGMEPDARGHLASFGKNGQLLKDPKHETVWKTAFVELYHEITGRYQDPERLGLHDRAAAEAYIRQMMPFKGY